MTIQQGVEKCSEMIFRGIKTQLRQGQEKEQHDVQFTIISLQLKSAGRWRFVPENSLLSRRVPEL